MIHVHFKDEMIIKIVDVLNIALCVLYGDMLENTIK